VSDDFTELVDRALLFFAELNENNTKPWFERHKDYYRDEIKRPAERLGEVLGDEITRLTGEQMSAKLFRIHRDIRFSKDKRPYNAHLHLMWSPETEGAPCWFFGAAPGYLLVGTGLMALKGEALERYRSMVDREGVRLVEALAEADNSVGAQVSDWGPEPLKRVPKPFAPDHPHGAFLRRKALTVTADLTSGWKEAGLVASIITHVRGLMPVWEILDEEFG
jgi:uncharacterized protein (TIGR02453 family)